MSGIDNSRKPSNNLFPLTLTLSLREREPRRPHSILGPPLQVCNSHFSSFPAFPSAKDGVSHRLNMTALEPPDLMYLESAKGWLMLGDAVEASSELERLDPELRKHPDVLEVSFDIHSRAGNWPVCMEIATAMLEAAPERPISWLNCAAVLHGLKKTQAAWHTLYSVLDRFPKVASIPYNLAVFGCALGHSVDALKMLERALALGGSNVRGQALEDPGLRPLLDNIGAGPRR